MPGGRDEADRLTELFAPFGPVDVRRMFGGAGLYRDGVMFGLVADDTIFLKADDTTATMFEREGCGPFVYAGKGKPVTMSYWRLPDRCHDDPDALVDFARAAFDVAVRARGAKRRPSSGKTGKPAGSRTTKAAPAKLRARKRQST